MILTGADPAFSAGVDLKEIGAGAAGGDDLRSGPAEPALADSTWVGATRTAGCRGGVRCRRARSC